MASPRRRRKGPSRFPPAMRETRDPVPSLKLGLEVALMLRRVLVLMLPAIG